MRVRGPNGMVIDVPESIATGLIGDGTRGYEHVPVEEKPKPRRRKTQAKAEEMT